jgi:hypothetical protein
MVTRVNSIDGTPYADDPAILGWELGIELFDVSSYDTAQADEAEERVGWSAAHRARPVPPAW